MEVIMTGKHKTQEHIILFTYAFVNTKWQPQQQVPANDPLMNKKDVNESKQLNYV